MSKTPGVMIGRFAGAPIYVQRSWFPLMALIVVGYGMRLASWQSLSTLQGYLAACIVAFTLALGVFFHELAHAAVGRANRAKVSSITLNMWGGQTLMQTTSASTALWVAVAGPLVNFIVAGLCQLIWSVTGTADCYGFHLAVQVNIAIGVFNLLPAFPLDGGYALEALVFMMVRRRSAAHMIVTYTGFLLLALLLSFLVLSGIWQNPLNLIIGLLLIAYIGAGLLPAIQKLGMNSDARHPLHIHQLIRPVNCEAEDELVGAVTQRWDGQSDILLVGKSPGKLAPHSVVAASTLRAARESLAYQPLAALAQPLQARNLTEKSGPIDTLDEFQGFGCHSESPAESGLSRAWLVTGATGPAGLVTAPDIAEALSRIPTSSL